MTSLGSLFHFLTVLMLKSFSLYPVRTSLNFICSSSSLAPSPAGSRRLPLVPLCPGCSPPEPHSCSYYSQGLPDIAGAHAEKQQMQYPEAQSSLSSLITTFWIQVSGQLYTSMDIKPGEQIGASIPCRMEATLHCCPRLQRRASCWALPAARDVDGSILPWSSVWVEAPGVLGTVLHPRLEFVPHDASPPLLHRLQQRPLLAHSALLL